MMEKFVIVLVDDATGLSKYWDGRSMQDNQDACITYGSKTEARSAMASLTSTFSNANLSVRRAKISLAIE